MATCSAETPPVGIVHRQLMSPAGRAWKMHGRMPQGLGGGRMGGSSYQLDSYLLQVGTYKHGVSEAVVYGRWAAGTV